MLAPDLGEPFLAPDFMCKVRRMREAGVRLIQVTTNATVLHRVGIDEIVSDEGPDLINISLPGFDEEAYRRVYRSRLYGQVRSNVLELLRANDAQGHPKTITVRLRGDLPHDELLAASEVPEVMQRADDLTVMTAVDDWIGTIRDEMLPGELEIQKERPPLTKRPCSVMFNLTVHPDGDLHLCSCRNIFHDPDLHIGNIRQMSVLEAYRAIFDILDRWEAGHIPEICHNCSMYCDPAEAVLGRFKRIVVRRFLDKYEF
jgi:radical SAM protein with 4Fe4S-binding SPASM domain